MKEYNKYNFKLVQLNIDFRIEKAPYGKIVFVWTKPKGQKKNKKW